MLERGDASAEDIDVAMKLGAGMPMGAPVPVLQRTLITDPLAFAQVLWSLRT